MAQATNLAQPVPRRYLRCDEDDCGLPLHHEGCGGLILDLGEGLSRCERCGIEMEEGGGLATPIYLTDRDGLQAWIQARTTQSETLWTPFAAIYSDYERWCGDRHRDWLGPKGFSQEMGKQFAQTKHSHNGGRGFAGVGLQP